MTVVDDAIGEWWILPLATQVESRVISGAISSTGDILAIEMDALTQKSKRIVVGQAEIDDHNCPAIWVEPGERMVLGWTTHGKEPRIYFKVSDTAGTVESFANATLQTYEGTAGISYIQMHKIEHLSDATQNTFWVFFRHTSFSWRFVPMTVAKSTGVLTFGEPVPLVIAESPRQCYLSTADAHVTSGNQVIRLAWGYNPSVEVHAIRFFEIDTVTGDITCPADPSFSANINGVNVPIPDSVPLPQVPESEAGYSRRLFYIRPGPARPAIAYADWLITDPDNATYKVMEQNEDKSWTVTSFGIAGPRVGFTALGNYISGMSFPSPAYDSTVVTAQRSLDNRQSTVTVHRADGTKEVKAQITSAYLMRPNFPKYQEKDVLVSGVTHYGNTTYTNYRAYAWLLGNQKSNVTMLTYGRVILNRKP